MPGDACLMFQPLKAAIKIKCQRASVMETRSQRQKNKELLCTCGILRLPFLLFCLGCRTKETWRRGAEGGEPLLYLLSCPGPSRPRRTECHRLRPVTSHSRSSDLPEPDPWSAAFLSGRPPQTLEEEELAFHFTFNASVLKSHTMKTNWYIYLNV